VGDTSLELSYQTSGDRFRTPLKGAATSGRIEEKRI